MTGTQPPPHPAVPLSLKARSKLLHGVVRRYLYKSLRPGYVRKSLSQRQGHCARCGTCCRLAWRCGFFTRHDGLPACRIHTRRRPPNCDTFPIDPRDIADRNLIAPHIPCGYFWPNTPSNRESTPSKP